MDPNMQQQQFYYAQGAPNGASSMPATGHYAPGYYAAPAPAPGPAGDSNGYVLPMQPQMMYYAPATGACSAPNYAYAAPMYYQPPEVAFAAMSLSGQTVLPMQQTPGASSTTSNSSQPRAASTPIPSEEPASLAAPTGCNPSMIPMHVMYTQMPQYYPMGGYDGSAPAPQMMPTMMYQDPTTGQFMQPQMQQQPMQQVQQMQQHQQQHMGMHRMMSSDADAPENIDDISQISHQSSPDSFMEPPGQRHGSTPVSSMRRRTSLPPGNQQSNSGAIPNLLPSNYKTRMCTQWLEKRECSMAANCKFAHGNAELRLPERPFRAINNPKYKTKMCKNFEPGASGLCAYADRCEYIHPTDREYITYKARAEANARSRGDFTRFKALLDEVPCAGARKTRRQLGDDDSSKSVRSADSSCEGGEDSPLHAPRDRRGSAREGGGYLGSGMPPSMTRSALRMGAGADAPSTNYFKGGQMQQQPLRRNLAGGSMYNLAYGGGGGGYERDEYRSRLTRVPSASNVSTLGTGNRRYGERAAPAPAAKFNRRSSMCHLNTAEY